MTKADTIELTLARNEFDALRVSLDGRTDYLSVFVPCTDEGVLVHDPEIADSFAAWERGRNTAARAAGAFACFAETPEGNRKATLSTDQIGSLARVLVHSVCRPDAPEVTTLLYARLHETKRSARTRAA